MKQKFVLRVFVLTSFYYVRICILKGRKHYEEDWEENVYNIYLTVQYVLVWHVIIYQVLILSYYCISISTISIRYTCTMTTNKPLQSDNFIIPHFCHSSLSVGLKRFYCVIVVSGTYTVVGIVCIVC